MPLSLHLERMTCGGQGDVTVGQPSTGCAGCLFLRHWLTSGACLAAYVSALLRHLVVLLWPVQVDVPPENGDVELVKELLEVSRP